MNTFVLLNCILFSKYTFLPQNIQNTHFCVWKIHIFTPKYTFFPRPIHIFGKCQNFEWQVCNQYELIKTVRLDKNRTMR